MGEAIRTFVFDNDDAARPLRMVMLDGAPWFVAKDVCAAIDVVNHRDALSALDDDEKGVGLTDTLGGAQDMAIVSESGLYTLILRSRQATTAGTLAHRFRRWVTGEVLPSIRQAGGYAAGAETPLHEINTKARLIELATRLRGRPAGIALWERLLPEYELLTSARLTPPGKVENGLDQVQQFIADCCTSDPAGRVQSRHLYEAFCRWMASEHPTVSMSQKTMAACLEGLGIEKDRGRLFYYLGIRLKHISEQLA